MLEVFFIVCFVTIIIFTIIFYRLLDSLLALEQKDNELHKITLLSECLTKQNLMRDFKFYFSVIIGSYKRKITSRRLITCLDKIRKYLLGMYVFGSILFLIPIISKFTFPD